MPTPTPMQQQIRYEAQWIEKQHIDADGEWNPDKDEYGCSYHPTRDGAVAAAIARSKTAHQCEWILIAEQRYIGHEWVDQRRWTGDWENGIVQQTYVADDEG